MNDTDRLAKIKKQRNNYGSDVHRHAAVKVSDLQWLIEQAEQTESFKKLHKSYLDRYVDSVGEINRLREALAFYADADTYTDDRQHTSRGELVHTGYTKIQGDYGERARKAMEGI